MNIIGLDLSIAGTGICVQDDGATCGAAPAACGFRAWTIRLPPALGDRRLGILRRAVAMNLTGVDFAVLEDLPRNAMNAAPTAMVQGVIRDELITHGIPYVLVVPSTLKLYATGHGRAEKRDMVTAMREATEVTPDSHNAADAFWLWHAGMDRTGAPVCRLPAARRRGLDVVNWVPVQDVIDSAIMREAGI